MNSKLKILVISLSGIGDTLLATPLIRELRRCFPFGEIDVLVMWKGAKEILETNPYVDKVYQINMVKEGFWKSLIFCLKLRKRKYDVSINIFPQSKIHYAIVSWVIGARIRIGYLYQRLFGMDKVFLHKTMNIDLSLHCVENNLKLLELLGNRPESDKVEIFYTHDDKSSVEDTIKKLIKNKFVVGIHPGSGKTKNLVLKRWPISNYISLIKRLSSIKDVMVLVFIGPSEEDVKHFLKSKLKAKNIRFLEFENLRKVSWAIKYCHCFVSVDGLLMHLAALQKTSCQIVIRSPTFCKTVEPYKNPYKLVGKPFPNDIFYKFDGKGIQGDPKKIIEHMKNITPLMVSKEIEKCIEKWRKKSLR